MTQNKNSHQIKFQPESNLLAQSPLKSVTKSKTANNTCLKLGISISLAAAIHAPSINQVAQATDLTNFSVQSLSPNKNVGFDSRRRQNRIATFLPRILSFITFPVKHRSANSSNSWSKFKPTSVGSPITNQINTANILAERQKSYQITKIESSALFANAKSSSVTSQPLIHQVQQGDTINQIAKKYQVSRDELIKLNQIKNSNIIFVNQRLKIPATATNKFLLQQPESKLRSSNISQAIKQQTHLRQTSASLAQQAPLNNLSKRNQERTEIETSQDDPYIAKLRAEIELLRAQSNQQKSETDTSATSASLNSVANSKQKYQLKSNPEKSSGVMPQVNSSQPKYNLQPDLLESDAVALTLPPLPDSEEYLPSAFDGYSWPARGVLTSGYGWRWGRLHRGIDIAAPIGTPVLAAASGEVVGAGWHGGYGNLIKLEHLDGSVTLYAHNHKILVSHGQKVNQGEQIAEMGSTGNSTGSHLHFEIHSRNQEVINPLALLGSK